MNLFEDLHDSQKQLVAEILMGSHHTVVANCGRTYGKDVAVITSAISLLQEGKDILILGHNHDDNRKIFELIRKMDVCGYFDYLKSPLQIINPNGGVIKFKSYSNADNIRGNNFNDICFLNEAALLDDDAYLYVLKPMFRTFKKVIITSTPRPTDWYRRIVKQGLEGSNRVWALTASTFANPYANKEEIELDRLSMPDAIFRQEYLAEFVDDSGTVFTEPSRAFTLSGYASPTEKNFAGVDFGVKNDYTVLHILNAHGQTIYKDRFREDSVSRLAERIMPKIKEYKATTLAESNGLGVFAVKELHNHAPNLIHDFTQTNKTKEDIIGLLKLDISDTPCKVNFCQDHSNLLHELTKLEYKQLTTGKLRYEAATGHHDDEVVAVALANFARRKSIPRR